MGSHIFLGFLGILGDGFQIFFHTHNSQLMMIITLFTILINSIFYLINFFSTKHFLTDFLIKQDFLPLITNPNSQESLFLIYDLKTHIGFFLEFMYIIILIKTLISLFLSTAIIYASAMIHSGKPITLKDILSKTKESWKRSLITLFYTNILGAGYTLFFIITIFPILVILILSSKIVLHTSSIIISVLAMIIYAYVSIVWILALVVSILEEKSGIEALAKANEIVNGMRLYGFFINLVASISTYVLFKGVTTVGIKQATWGKICVSLLVLICMWMVQIFGLVVYSVYYLKCKKNVGEEVELKGGMEYSQVSKMPLMDEV